MVNTARVRDLQEVRKTYKELLAVCERNMRREKELGLDQSPETQAAAIVAMRGLEETDKKIDKEVAQ